MELFFPENNEFFMHLFTNCGKGSNLRRYQDGKCKNIITRLKNGMINKIVAKIAGSLIAVTVKMS